MVVATVSSKPIPMHYALLSDILSTFQVLPVVRVSAANPVAGAVQLADPQQILQGNAPGRALVMNLPLRISPGPRNQDEYDVCCGTLS